MSFQFKCYKWHILTEMTAIYGIYLYIFLLTKGDIPPCGAEWGVWTPPAPNPDPLRAETLHNDWTNVALAQLLVRRRASTWRWWTASYQRETQQRMCELYSNGTIIGPTLCLACCSWRDTSYTYR